MEFHWLDAIIVGAILLSIVTGLIRGFVKELFALVIWILALWFGYQYAPLLEPYLAKWVHDSTLRFGIGFVLVMVFTLVLGGILNALLGILMKKSGLSSTDRILGMGFGFARGVFIVSLGLVVLQLTSLSREPQVKDSRLMAKFNPIVEWMSLRVPFVLEKMRRIDDKTQFSNAMMPTETSVLHAVSQDTKREKGHV